MVSILGGRELLSGVSELKWASWKGLDHFKACQIYVL